MVHEPKPVELWVWGGGKMEGLPQPLFHVFQATMRKLWRGGGSFLMGSHDYR